MGLFDRLEGKLDRVINGAFARAFRAEVQPVEIASAMRRAMDERAAVVGKGRTMVPNAFTIELDPSDYERLTMYEDVLVDELLAAVDEHVESQRYLTEGPLHVDFVQQDDLNTGVFRVRPRAQREVPAQPRHSSRAQRRFEEERRAKRAKQPTEPKHKPRNLPHPPEATAAAEGPAGLAGHAATAATGAAAGTAAAGRSGSYIARHESAEEHEAREAQRQRDRDAWGDDESEQTPGDERQGAPGARSRSPERPPMRIYGDERRDEGWDEPWQSEPAPESQGSAERGDRDPSRDSSPDSRRDSRTGDDRDEPYRRSESFQPVERPAAPAPRAPEPEPTVAQQAAPPLPDPAHRPWLELDGDTYPLLAAITVLGRDSGADITLDDPGVSRRHAELRVTHDGPHLVVGLRDLGSTNGTYVNGERIASHRLGDGDRVTVGRVSFIVRTRRR